MRRKFQAQQRIAPEFDRMIDQFREGNELYVWRLYRLGRSLNGKDIIIKSLTDGVDTSTINGWLFLNLMISLAEYERELIKEVTNTGLQSARARGRTGGRPKGYTKEAISILLIMSSVYKGPTKSP
ncbi:recombinase family protein [Elizabethkingia miricola]|uniref:recombinase family protein n=1 Tax=Elizabethkingia miricola TaxID=172045 RepID=UPI002599872E|nr:recombinase family protein [uncultured Elizabethkingia sp.]